MTCYNCKKKISSHRGFQVHCNRTNHYPMPLEYLKYYEALHKKEMVILLLFHCTSTYPNGHSTAILQLILPHSTLILQLILRLINSTVILLPFYCTFNHILLLFYCSIYIYLPKWPFYCHSTAILQLILPHSTTILLPFYY